MKSIKSSGNVFADIGIPDVEAEELAVKADLVTLLLRAIRQRRLTQKRAAEICGSDQPTLSKVLGGKLDGVTIDRIARWLVLLGGIVQINVEQPKARLRYKGEIRVHAL
ncbi:MAG: helix-turn-helix domain-containing protein [Terriglobia bacterium]